MKLLIVAVVTLLAGAHSYVAQACPGSSDPVAGDEQKSHADAEAVTLAIKGMSCGGCAARIASTLKKLDGVYAAKVVFEQKRAYVSFGSTKISVAQLIEAVEELGYKASIHADVTS